MKNGFSFTILASTVIIMVILLTSLTIAGSKTIEDSTKLSFATEIYSLQQAVDSYSSKNNGMYPVKNNIVLDIKELDESSQNQFSANGEEIVNDKVVLNEIDYEKITITSLKYGNSEDGETDIYAVSPTTGKVYYAKGVKVGSKSYFTLTDELMNTLSTNSTKANKASKNNNELVIFSPSTVNWTTENITVDIKVPNVYNMQYIFVDSEATSDYITSQIPGYNVYTLTKDGNYTLKVKYYKIGDTDTIFSATYNVNNVDNVSPTLQIDENLVSFTSKSDDTNLIGYLSILDKKDTLSGIKTFKYESNSAFSGVITESQKQNVKAHFENSGKEIQSLAIPIEKGSRNVTVYIEDNAGNWTLQTIKISQN